MNYLAHVYLSGADPDLSIGNFIADQVKGKSYVTYPYAIQRGILLHRKIDDFTDRHPLFKKNVRLLFPTFRHYSRVIVDMFFDHFLATQWREYHHQPLEQFSSDFYDLIDQYPGTLPHKINNMIPFLIDQNWFMDYATVEGLEKILKQMSRRTQYPVEMDRAVIDLKANYIDIKDDFNVFFESLEKHVAEAVLKI